MALQPVRAQRAVIVVHGIGVQRRHGGRDELVRALEAHGATTLPVDADPEVGFGPPLPALPVPRVRRVRDGVAVDVYEVYWAPLASGRTTAREVLGWGLGTTFVPGRVPRRPSRKTVLDAAHAGGWLLLGVAFLGVVLAMLGQLTLTARCGQERDAVRRERLDCPAGPELATAATDDLPDSVGQALRRVRATGTALARALPSPALAERPLGDLAPSNAAAVLTAVSVRSAALLALLGWLVAQLGYRLTQARRGPPRWGIAAVDAALALVVVSLVPPVLAALLVVFLVTTVVLRGAQRFLTETIGDIALYSTTDENSSRYAVREQILAAAQDVFGEVQRRGYAEVVVVGHSLGTVIALDALRQARARSAELGDQVVAFVTLGAALEKVRHCFDRKRSSSPVDDWNAEVAETLQGVGWLNLYYRSDVVANPITTFQGAGPRVWRPAGTPVPELLAESRRRLVVNLVLPAPRALWSHSHYLRSEPARRIIADVVFGPGR